MAEKQKHLEVTTAGLGAALNRPGHVVRRAVERGVELFTRDAYYTPGGHLRWKPMKAAEIVRALGLTPPKAWEEPPAAVAPKRAHRRRSS